MNFTFADGITCTVVPGTVVTVNESVRYTPGTSNFPYTPDNRWVVINDSVDSDLFDIRISPTKETLNAINAETGQLYSASPTHAGMISEMSGGTISAMEARYYCVKAKDVVPLDEVIAINIDTLGVIPHYCYYCGSACDTTEPVDDRYICSHCAEDHTFVCSECGEVHDKRRKMKGTLDLCRPCFEALPEKYRRAEDGNVYRIEDLVTAKNFDSINYYTPAFAENNTFVCPECGERHLNNDGIVCYGRRYCTACADRKYPLCNHCHRRHIAANTFSINGVNVCKRCRDVYYVVCDFCGKYHESSRTCVTEDTGKKACLTCQTNLYRCSFCGRFREEPYERYSYVGYYGSRHNDYLCPSCLGNFTPCADCGILVHNTRRNNTFPDGKKYCPDCAPNHFFHCATCGKWISITDGASYHGDGDNRICHECYEDLNHGLGYMLDASDTTWLHPNGISNYSYKPDGIAFPAKDNVGLYYGIELESERHSDSAESATTIANRVNDILGFTYAKHDGSLGWDGIEFVSHPATIKYYMDNKGKFAKAMKYLRNHGYQSHCGGSCGLHVHVSSFPILYDTENGVEKLLYIWDKFWNNIVKCSRRGSSDGGRWATRIRCDVDGVTGGVKNEMESLKETKENSKNSGRYQAINLQNSHTIEFRLMRGTLNIDTFIGSLQLISTIVDIVMAKTYEEIKEMTWDDVLAFHDYAELKALWESHKNYSIRDCGSLMCDDDNTRIADDTLAEAA